MFAEIIKHLALARESEFFLAALDQERFELPLQRADLLTDGGLGDTVYLGGFGETFRFGEIAKDFQAFNLHKAIQCESPSRVN